MSERERQLAEILSDRAITLEDEPDADATLRMIVHSSVDLVPGVTIAGVSFVDGTQIVPRAPPVRWSVNSTSCNLI